MTLDYKKLQNGSDIRGVAVPGAEGEEVNLGEEAAGRLTKGFLAWLREKTGKDPADLRISVGHDSRISAETLKRAVCGALLSGGVKVYDCGLASTPAMFMSTVFEETDCDGAVMITASHLPYHRNGFKYFSREGGLEKNDIASIIEWAEKAEEPDGGQAGTPAGRAVEADLLSIYSEYLRKKIISEVNHPENYERPLEGLHILVDAGNGAGGFFAERILEPLGADITGSQFLEPDGMFPNHPPNPENKEAMRSISEAVLKYQADLGLIFDTDVDRSAAVDKNGREISRNGIVALAAALIAKEHPGTTVVTDSITSDQLTEYLTKCLGLKHKRFKRGYRNVINESIRLNAEGIDSQLAIETSGHAAYKENYFLDDGAYLATKIVIKAAQLRLKNASVDEMLSGLEEPLEAIEVRLPIGGEDFGAYGDRILADLREWAESRRERGVTVVEPNYEGVRLTFDLPEVRGWCLLRKSLHDPILPLNVEVDRGSCEIILEILASFLSDYPRVKLT